MARLRTISPSLPFFFFKLNCNKPFFFSRFYNVVPGLAHSAEKLFCFTHFSTDAAHQSLSLVRLIRTRLQPFVTIMCNFPRLCEWELPHAFAFEATTSNRSHVSPCGAKCARAAKALHMKMSSSLVIDLNRRPTRVFVSSEDELSDESTAVEFLVGSAFAVRCDGVCGVVECVPEPENEKRFDVVPILLTKRKSTVLTVLQVQIKWWFQRNLLLKWLY